MLVLLFLSLWRLERREKEERELDLEVERVREEPGRFGSLLLFFWLSREREKLVRSRISCKELRRLEPAGEEWDREEPGRRLKMEEREEEDEEDVGTAEV